MRGIISLLLLIGLVAVPAHAGAAGAGNESDFPSRDSGYHNHDEMVAEIRSVADAHPDKVEIFSIGKSYEGRAIWAARISDDSRDNRAEPGVLYNGLHHGREHLTVEMTLYLLRVFTESTDLKTRSAVKQRQIYIIFSLNPDGGQYDLSSGNYREWRKNRQPNSNTREIGTDLNRNYGYRWGGIGSSSDPASETYRGPKPWSAPEVVAMRDFVDSHRNITTAISYHSYGGQVLYPYGYTTKDVPTDMTRTDHDTLSAMAKEMAGTTGYKHEQASDHYVTSGTFDDWAYGVHGIYAFTIELGGKTFYPEDEFIAGEVAKNRRAAVYVARMADCPTAVVGVGC